MCSRRGTKRRIKRLCLWSSFVLGLALCVVTAVGVVYIAYEHVTSMAAAGKTGEIVSDIVSFSLGVAITLAIELMWNLVSGETEKK
jgi:hypothetical protein